MTSSISFNTPESVMEVVTLLNELIDRDEELANRRLLPRRTLVLPVTVQLMDEHQRPCGEPYDAISLDLSADGLGILSQQTIDTPFALVQFRSKLGPHMPLLIEIRHVTPLGMFYKVGGRFHVDWTGDAGP